MQQFAIIVDEYEPAIEYFVEVLGFELVEDAASLTNDGRSKPANRLRAPEFP